MEMEMEKEEIEDFFKEFKEFLDTLPLDFWKVEKPNLDKLRKIDPKVHNAKYKHGYNDMMGPMSESTIQTERL